MVNELIRFPSPLPSGDFIPPQRSLSEGELNETEIEWDASALAGLSNTKSATQLIQYSNQTSNETHSSTASGKSNSEQSTVDLANIREELNSMQHMFREVIQHEIRPFLESKVSAADFKAQFKANLGKVCSFRYNRTIAKSPKTFYYNTSFPPLVQCDR